MLTALFKKSLLLVLQMKCKPLAMAFLDQILFHSVFSLTAQVPSTKQKCFHSFSYGGPLLLSDSVELFCRPCYTLCLDNFSLVLQSSVPLSLCLKECWDYIVRCVLCHLFCSANILFTFYNYLFNINLLH